MSIPRTTEQWKEWERTKASGNPSSQNSLQSSSGSCTISGMSAIDAEIKPPTKAQIDYLKDLVTRVVAAGLPGYDIDTYVAEAVATGRYGVSKSIDSLRKTLHDLQDPSSMVVTAAGAVQAPASRPVVPVPGHPGTVGLGLPNKPRVEIREYNWVVNVFVTNGTEDLLVQQFTFTGRGKYRRDAAFSDAENFTGQLKKVLGL